MLLEEIKPVSIEAQIDALLEYDFGPIIIKEGQLLEEGLIDTIKSKLPDYIKDAKQTISNLANRPDVLMNTANAMAIKIQKLIQQIPYDKIKQKATQVVNKLGLRVKGVLEKTPPKEAYKRIGIALLAIPMIRTLTQSAGQVGGKIKDAVIENVLEQIAEIAAQQAGNLAMDIAGGVGVAVKAGKAAAGAAKELHSAHQAAQQGPFKLQQAVQA